MLHDPAANPLLSALPSSPMADRDPFAGVAKRIVADGQLLSYWPLVGGVSASMHGLEIAGPDGETHRFVVRRHRDAEWKPQEANVTATEFALLQALHRLGMAVPSVCLLDESGELFATPYLVMELVEGTTEVAQEALPEALRQMAAYLARLHTLEIEGARLPALPQREDPREGALAYLPADAFGDSMRRLLSSEHFTQGTHDPKSGTATRRSLLHGDYWPENVLWHQGQIAAVIDWEDAALGDPLSDLACSRVELLCRYDRSAMEKFTQHYLALTEVDRAGLALWELYVSSAAAATMAEWGLEPEVEAKRREKTVWFMEQAGRDLLAQSD